MSVKASVVNAVEAVETTGERRPLARKLVAAIKEAEEAKSGEERKEAEAKVASAAWEVVRDENVSEEVRSAAANVLASGAGGAKGAPGGGVHVMSVKASVVIVNS